MYVSGAGVLGAGRDWVPSPREQGLQNKPCCSLGHNCAFVHHGGSCVRRMPWGGLPGAGRAAMIPCLVQNCGHC